MLMWVSEVDGGMKWNCNFPLCETAPWYTSSSDCVEIAWAARTILDSHLHFLDFLGGETLPSS
jgi:hypothetical protein